MKKPRHLCVDILNRVDAHGAFAEPLIDTTLSRNHTLHLHDKRLITQIVYGTLRMRGRLDWIIDLFYKGSFVSMEPCIKNILRTGIYQMLFTERIPDFAIVDEAVEITKKLRPAGAGLVNAILRSVIREKDAIVYPEMGKDPSLHISIVHSHPLWLVKKWIDTFGIEDAAALCRANNVIPPVTLRVNTLKTTREKVHDELTRDGVDVRPGVFSPDCLIVSSPFVPVRDTALFQAGHIQLQDEASQLISLLVGPREGEHVLDLCAGSGGKTTHLAARMENRGTITAVDMHTKKLEALRKNARRLGVTTVNTKVRDARQKPEEPWRETFDKVLVDAPCSGLGTLRRNPEIKWRLSPEDVTESALLQKAILDNAASFVKKGGSLVYSTCTIMPEENEDIVEEFISLHRNFICVHPPDAIDSRIVDDRGCVRSYPHLHGVDGFFGAVLRKKG